MSIDSAAQVRRPSATRDFGFFYEGLNRDELLVQACDECGRRRHPASPMCPACQSLSWRAEILGNEGSVYSFVVHHQPPYPDYPSPHVVALVQMAPDIRVLGALIECAPEDVAIGMPVRTQFVQHDGFKLHAFVPVTA